MSNAMKTKTWYVRYRTGDGQLLVAEYRCTITAGNLEVGGSVFGGVLDGITINAATADHLIAAVGTTKLH
jgi:hypothetical protein